MGGGGAVVLVVGGDVVVVGASTRLTVKRTKSTYSQVFHSFFDPSTRNPRGFAPRPRGTVRRLGATARLVRRVPS